MHECKEWNIVLTNVVVVSSAESRQVARGSESEGFEAVDAFERMELSL
jgi:hypothetical protein